MRRAALVLLTGCAGAAAWAQEPAGWTTFHTPSGNIHCLGADDPASGSFVDCELLETSAPPSEPRPDWCDLDWGRRFGMGESGPAEMGCAGDTVVDPGGAVLPYGEAIAFGAIRCESSERGLECRNGDGHGFVLSRAAQRLY